MYLVLSTSSVNDANNINNTNRVNDTDRVNDNDSVNDNDRVNDRAAASCDVIQHNANQPTSATDDNLLHHSGTHAHLHCHSNQPAFQHESNHKNTL